MQIAKSLEKPLGTGGIDLITAKVGHAIGATGYFKKTKINDYYKSILKSFKKAQPDWSSQGKVVLKFHDIGHFIYCPKSLINNFLYYLVLWYIGEPGGYGYWGSNRAVFYSNDAAPIIKRIVKNSNIPLYEMIENFRDNQKFSEKISNKHIFQRFEMLLDYASEIKSDD